MAVGRAEPQVVSRIGRIDVEADQGLGLRDLATAGVDGKVLRYTWEEFSGARSNDTAYVEFTVHRFGWSQGHLRFTPARDGHVWLRLRGPCVDCTPVYSPDEARVLYDELQVQGTVIPPPNPGFEEADPSQPNVPAGWTIYYNAADEPLYTSAVRLRGSRSALVWHERSIQTRLAVRANVPVNIEVWGRSYEYPGLAATVQDAVKARFDMLSASVPLEFQQLTPAGAFDSAERPSWDGEFVRAYSYTVEVAMTPWVWTPFEFICLPRSTGDVRLKLMGPYQTSGSGTVLRQEVEWDGMEVEGALLQDGGFEAAPPENREVVQDPTAKEGDRIGLLWHDEFITRPLAVTAGMPLVIRGWVRSPRRAEEAPPVRLSTETPAHRTARYYQQGINLGNYLEEGTAGRIAVTEEDFARIRAAGFDHVRVPVAWHDYHGGGSPPAIGLSIFTAADRVIELATAHGLAILLDWHRFDVMMSDLSGQTDRFLRGWEQITTHYAMRAITHPSERIAFELLNEPTGECSGASLNQLYATAIRRIRVIDTTRPLFLSPGELGGPQALRGLQLPEGESNVVVTVHCYAPFLFTHQGASWSPPAPNTDRVGVRFPGPLAVALNPPPNATWDWVEPWFDGFNNLPEAANPSSARAFRPLFALAQEWSEHHGRPVHVGEFGVYRKWAGAGAAHDVSARHYYTQMRRAFAEAGLGWALWEWKSGFGYWDPNANQPRRGTVSGIWGRPEIISQPQGKRVVAGETVTMEVEAWGDELAPELVYQWRRDGNPVPGANVERLTLVGVTRADAGAYSVLVSNSVGSTESKVAALVVNTAPVFGAIPEQGADELSLFSLQLRATDADDPAQTLTYALVSGPTGLTVTGAGLVGWTPTEAEGPGTNAVEVKVTDNGFPALAATNRLEVVVREVNTAPVLTKPADQTLDEVSALSLQLSAKDADVPRNALSFSLVRGPDGMTVDAAGVLSWTPSAEQVFTTNTVIVQVTDDGASPLSDQHVFTLKVEGQEFRIEAVVKEGAQLQIRWEARSGAWYRVETLSVLPSGEWGTVTDVKAEGSRAQCTVPIGLGTGFYRVRRLW